jgi:hypothetical protein
VWELWCLSLGERKVFGEGRAGRGRGGVEMCGCGCGC